MACEEEAQSHSRDQCNRKAFVAVGEKWPSSEDYSKVVGKIRRRTIPILSKVWTPWRVGRK